MARQQLPQPNLITRARIAWTVFRRGFPAALSMLAGGQTKQDGVNGSTPFVWSAWREESPQWQTTDFGAYVEEGFNLNSLIYSAIMYKARSKMSAPLRAYGGDPNRPEVLPADHALTRLVSRPNRAQSWPEFQTLLEIYYNLGNAFIMLVRPLEGGMPESMFTLRPDRVYIIPGQGQIKGYLYVPEGSAVQEGTPILPQDMMHVKLPNPGDPLEGLGWGMPPTAIGQSTDVDNDVTRFLKLFFQNGAMPLGLLKFNVPLSDETLAAVKRRWMEMYGGVDNWTDVGVLDNGGDYQRVGATFEEMGFEAIDERNESRILGPLGVPPILIGTRTGLARSTYSNYETARRAFWEDTALPELRLFEKEFQYFLQSEDGGYVAYDLSRVPALQQDIPTLVDAAHKLWQMGTPANQAYETVGLNVAEVPGGNVGYVPANLVPVGMEVEEEGEDMVGAAEAESDDRKQQEAEAQRPASSPRPQAPSPLAEAMVTMKRNGHGRSPYNGQNGRG